MIFWKYKYDHVSILLKLFNKRIGGKSLSITKAKCPTRQTDWVWNQKVSWAVENRDTDVSCTPKFMILDSYPITKEQEKCHQGNILVEKQPGTPSLVFFPGLYRPEQHSRVSHTVDVGYHRMEISFLGQKRRCSNRRRGWKRQIPSLLGLFSLMKETFQ